MKESSLGHASKSCPAKNEKRIKQHRIDVLNFRRNKFGLQRFMCFTMRAEGGATSAHIVSCSPQIWTAYEKLLK